MGRWSRVVAPLFVDWLDAPAKAAWIDIGCGTGVLTEAILDGGSALTLVGVDSSAAFLDAAKRRIDDPRVSFRVAKAQALPLEDATVDVAAAGLVLNFVPDKEAAVREMVRVTRSGGTVALYVWDYAAHMQMMRHFFDAALALDDGARAFDDGFNAPICRPGPLTTLLQSVGAADVAVKPIDIPTAFDSFDDYWSPFLGGAGSAPKYVTSLDEGARDTLREAVRRRLPLGPDGEILLAARAWAVKGRAP